MKITKLTLYDHIRLRVSRIREIEINTEYDNIQLIIGSNGSGKSSIMHEFFPYAPNKSSFGKTGFKSLELQHDNHEFVLNYDTTYGHTFFKDGTNLNIGMTYDIQKALIQEHFGITNDIHTLLKGALPICEMIPSQRKKILMNLNPVDISIFLDKYQKVHKDVVAYSNNLDRLYTRQKQLMTQQLPNDVYAEMLDRKNILENQEKLLLVWMTTISSELSLYPDVSGYEGLPDDIMLKIRDMFQKLPTFRNVERDGYEREMIECSTKSEMISYELKEMENNLADIISVLNDYEAKKAVLAVDGCNVEEELSNLLIKLKDYNFDDTFAAIPNDSIPQTNDRLNTIQQHLVELSYCSYNEVLDKEELNHVYRQLIELKGNDTTISAVLCRLNQQYDEVKKGVRLYTTGNNCKKDDCELLRVYINHNETKQLELNRIKDEIQKEETNHAKIKEQCGEIEKRYQTQQMIWKYIRIVIDIIHNDSYLKRIFDDDLILNRIRQSPTLLIGDIQRYISESMRFDEYTKLCRRVQELERINASLASKKQLSIDLLNTEIESHSKRLDILREKYNIKVSYLHQIHAKRSVLLEFSTMKDRAHALKNKVDIIEHQASQKASREYVINLYNILSKILTSVRSSLIELTELCKQQEMLTVRLDTEINKVIDELKPRYNNAKMIEKSLFNLPIEYTTSFVNDIITTTNYLINKVMTYPMNLVPIDEGDVCDFTFPVMIENNIKVKDILLCSDGQKAVINLAFNLAVIIELGFNNYPIFCDEVDRALDTTHCKRLTKMLIGLIDDNVIQQLFIVGHHSSMLNHFSNSGNITVLNGNNIVLPASYNVHTKIVHE